MRENGLLSAGLSAGALADRAGGASVDHGVPPWPTRVLGRGSGRQAIQGAVATPQHGPLRESS